MAPGMEENPGSFLATISPTGQDLELSEQDQDAAQAVKAWPAGCEGRQHQEGLRIRMAHVL